MQQPLPQPKTTILFFLDVLGFSQFVDREAWDVVAARYADLVDLVAEVGGTFTPGSAFDQVVGDDRAEPPDGLGAVLLSDTILLWADYRPEFVDAFVELGSEFFCGCLRHGFGLRGGLAVGPMAIDPAAGVYLGRPLVEAAAAEKHQRWAGVAICQSAIDAGVPSLLRRTAWTEYEGHLKPGAGIGRAVIDWRRMWEMRYPELDQTDHVIELKAATPHPYWDEVARFLTAPRSH